MNRCITCGKRRVTHPKSVEGNCRECWERGEKEHARHLARRDKQILGRLKGVA